MKIQIPEEIKEYYGDWYTIVAFDNHEKLAGITIIHIITRSIRTDIWELKNKKFEFKFEGEVWRV